MNVIKNAGVLRAVLFDMDGTLTDSEKLWSQGLDIVAASLGGELSLATRQAMVGTDLVSSMEMFIADIGVTVSVQTAQDRLVAAVAELFATALEWRPGARELLQQVKAAALPTALVTSTHRDLTMIAMKTLGAHHFDTVVCGDDVRNTKPHPDPYLTALRHLGVHATAAIAIEDSPVGATSATAAGIATLVVPAEVPVAPGPLRVIQHTLVGMTVPELARLRTQLQTQ